jgi:hypothetical protein
LIDVGIKIWTCAVCKEGFQIGEEGGAVHNIGGFGACEKCYQEHKNRSNTFTLNKHEHKTVMDSLGFYRAYLMRNLTDCQNAVHPEMKNAVGSIQIEIRLIDDAIRKLLDYTCQKHVKD